MARCAVEVSPLLRGGWRTHFVDVGVDAERAVFARMMVDDGSVPFCFIKQYVIHLLHVVGRWDLGGKERVGSVLERTTWVRFGEIYGVATDAQASG
jgi:hypothetical protein